MKKLKTLLCVVVCVNENWVALLFQDSLVLCSVKCKGRPLGTIYLSLAFEVLGPRARLAKVLSRLFLGALARADRGAIKQHNEKRGSFSANANYKRQKPDNKP